MAKCEICGKRVEETFLGKVAGTYVKDNKGVIRLICFECQKKFRTKDKILKNLK
ncbi:MAG: hypothetical protein QXW00_04245 [Candidatus Woesearchaeota archaeon]